MKDELGQKMKEWFENRTKTKLVKKVPVIIRLDGRAFHTFTRGFERPFDENLMNMMNQAALALCNEIQGAKMAYVQSDEISILITDLDKEETEAWFDFQGHKMSSVSATVCANAFNKVLLKYYFSKPTNDEAEYLANEVEMLRKIHDGSLKFAEFDARPFSVPRVKDLTDYFVWRMKDARKNSISMLAQSMFSPKQLDRKHSGLKIDMCKEKGVDWNELHSHKRLGRIIVREEVWKETEYPIKDEKFEDGSARTEDGKNYVRRKVWTVQEETIPFWEDNTHIESALNVAIHS